MEFPATSYRLTHQPFSQRTKGHRFEHHLDLPLTLCILHLRLMLQHQLQRRNTGRGIPQGMHLCDTSGQNNCVGGHS